jgi:hypothetical protein
VHHGDIGRGDGSSWFDWSPGARMMEAQHYGKEQGEDVRRPHAGKARHKETADRAEAAQPRIHVHENEAAEHEEKCHSLVEREVLQKAGRHAQLPAQMVHDDHGRCHEPESGQRIQLGTPRDQDGPRWQ